MIVTSMLVALLALSFYGQTVYAQKFSEEDLIGEWKYIGQVDQKEIVECPDVFSFKGNGKYFLYNDCRGDRENPVVEIGKWDFDKGNMKIKMYDRSFETKYYFGGKRGNLQAIIKNVSGDEIHLCFSEAADCNPERYIRTEIFLRPSGSPD